MLRKFPDLCPLWPHKLKGNSDRKIENLRPQGLCESNPGSVCNWHELSA
jgi:hypothetical protein